MLAFFNLVNTDDMSKTLYHKNRIVYHDTHIIIPTSPNLVNHCITHFNR